MKVDVRHATYLYFQSESILISVASVVAEYELPVDGPSDGDTALEDLTRTASQLYYEDEWLRTEKLEVLYHPGGYSVGQRN